MKATELIQQIRNMSLDAPVHVNHMGNGFEVKLVGVSDKALTLYTDVKTVEQVAQEQKQWLDKVRDLSHELCKLIAVVPAKSVLDVKQANTVLDNISTAKQTFIIQLEMAGFTAIQQNDVKFQE